jgi:hypothetical protein
MTPGELNEQAVVDLGGGNTVAPREALKRVVAELLEALDRHDKGEEQTNLGDPKQIDNLIAGLDAQLDAFLAVAFPLVEYGGKAGQEAVATSLARIAREADRDTRTPGWSRAMLAIGARLLWVCTAFALAASALDFLPRLLRVTNRSKYGDRDEALVSSSSSRFLDAYNGDAAVSFEAHERWLAERSWIRERYPLLSHRDELAAYLLEADLVLAIASALADGSGAPYCHGAYRDGLPAETRLRAHAAEPAQRGNLCEFLRLPDAELEPRLNEIWVGFRRPGSWVDSTSLLPVRQAQG